MWACPQVDTANVEPFSTVLLVRSLLEHSAVTSRMAMRPYMSSASVPRHWAAHVHQLQPASGADHIIPCSLLVPSSEVLSRTAFVVEIAMSVFEPAALFVKLDPHRGKSLACFMVYGGELVPKDGNAAVATIMTKRTLHLWTGVRLAPRVA